MFYNLADRVMKSIVFGQFVHVIPKVLVTDG